MSFSFGSGGGSNNPPTTQSSGFSFGSAATTGGGFSFGQKPAAQATSSGFSSGIQSSSFSFSSTQPPSGGFSFGNPSTVATQQPSQQTTSFGFGAAASQQTTKPSISFGAATTATAAKGGFGFGAAYTTASSGFGFGSSATATSQTSGFGFGTPNVATSTISSTPAYGAAPKPSFGAPASTSAFSLTPQSTATSKLFGLGSGTQSVSQTTTGSFNFGAPAQSTAQSGGINLNQSGQSLFPTSKTTSSNPPALGPSLTGLLMGQKPATTSSLATTTKSDPGAALQLSTSTSSAGSAFSLLSSKASATSSTTAASGLGFQLQGGATSTSGGFALGGAPQSAATALMPSAGKFSLYQPAGSAPTAQETPAQQRIGLTGTLQPPSISTPATTTASTSQAVQTSFPSTPSTSTASQTVNLKTSSSFLFGASTTTAAPTTNVATSKPTEGLSLGFKLPTATTTTPATSIAAPATTATGLATSLAPSTTGSAPALKYKELESKINKWKGDLEQQEHLFITQATQVNAWSKLLINNAEKITKLNDEFEKVTCDQERLGQELDFIKTQQDELEGLLQPLEEATKKQISSMSSSVHTHHADVERERTYNLAETIDGQLKRMSEDLREVIDHVNASSASGDTASPVSQISKILSAHMDSLQWLDTNSGALQQKLDELTKQVNQRKVEQESRLRLAFD